MSEFKAKFKGKCPVCNRSIPIGRLIKMLPEPLTHCWDTPDRHGPDGGEHCCVGQHYYWSRGHRAHCPPNPSKAVHRQCYDKGVERLELIREGGRFAPYLGGVKEAQEDAEARRARRAARGEKAPRQGVAVTDEERAVREAEAAQEVSKGMENADCMGSNL